MVLEGAAGGGGGGGGGGNDGGGGAGLPGGIGAPSASGGDGGNDFIGSATDAMIGTGLLAAVPSPVGPQDPLLSLSSPEDQVSLALEQLAWDEKSGVLGLR